ncbi:hypothetical protein [Acinetobacter guerrae]|uniref:hypothetical protein n=1 Tax=Acinetobacter guerrae TaxID=1843371 RepID=UPI00128E1267|nr:hypothetical protein [Acinetobacter guerrae]MPW44752.1 hypothetical protein [Acinetobacter guerrae]
MSVTVSYIDTTEVENNLATPEILEKEYENLACAYIPKLNQELTIYSNISHEEILFRVVEIRAGVGRDSDRFEILIHRLS